MIKYLIDVVRFMRKYPYKNGKFKTWLRNCFYLNWQKPAKWNIDVYYLYKRLKWRVHEWNMLRKNDLPY